jgi:hypothetical protein
MGDPRRKNFHGDDSRNVMRRYEEVLGVQVRLPGLSLRQYAHARSAKQPYMLLRHDQTLCVCTFPQPMPGHIRGSLKGLHLDKRFPAEPFAKEPVLGSSPRAIYHGAHVVCVSASG